MGLKRRSRLGSINQHFFQAPYYRAHAHLNYLSVSHQSLILPINKPATAIFCGFVLEGRPPVDLCLALALGRFLVIFQLQYILNRVGSEGFVFTWCLLGNKDL